ncbi:hypothetical protein MSG28_009434 [Choristoneura fumiferana]|uniref:Uncharacterized protein n=1 Tax=Choristoneura fumiferana TaxID=7141 RepID=A0ACC0KY67_CHOFU|nr:hypothetical protein MSG28_009434 [Choristoneura fumiferana]
MVIPGSPPESEAERWLEAGASATLGRVRYVAERACGARCYSGQAEAEAEAAAGAAAGAGRRAWRARPLREELPLLRRRRQLFEAELARAATLNVSLWLDTNEMVRIPVSGSVQLVWPRLVTAVEPAGDEALLAGVGAAAARWLRVRNPSPAHPLRVHALLAPALALPAPALTTAPQCVSEECVYSEGTFALAEWRAPHGGVAALPEAGPGEGEGEGGIALTLAPRAVVDFRVDFAPAQPALYHAHFYLRNNLTVVEGVELAGRGAVPSFELAGRRAGAAAPLLLQSMRCAGLAGGRLLGRFRVRGGGGGRRGGGGRWTVRRTVVARNTGAVPLRLRGWRLAGAPCRARGFRLEPCAPLALAPNESRALTVAFRADCSLARVSAALTLRAGAGAAPAAFRLLAAVPARLLPACARQLPRPPWEPALRAAGALLVLAALALVLAAAALDAERLLRRARLARAPPRRPRARRSTCARWPARPRRRRPRAAARRRTPPAPDPHAERKAFELWRVEMLRRDSPRAPDGDEEGRPAGERDPPRAAEPADRAEPDADADAEDRDPRTSSEDDAASTTTTDSSSPPDEPEHPEPSEPAAASEPPPPRPSSPPPAPLRPRRDASPPARRSEPPARPRATPGKHHARKDKVSKRRGERPPAAPARPSPPHAEPRGPQAGAGAGAGCALRWGASWSSVVAAGAPPPAPPAAPAPARRRSPPPAPAPDHSLFYFNDAAHSLRPPAPPAPPAPAPDYAWRGPDRSPFAAPAPSPRDYLEEPSNLTNNAYGTIGSPWSGGGSGEERAWAWSAGGVRPPPGFGPRQPPPPPPPVPAPAPAPVRTYDPFHSLASIWAPGAFDWSVDRERRDPHPPPASQ